MIMIKQHKHCPAVSMLFFSIPLLCAILFWGGHADADQPEHDSESVKAGLEACFEKMQDFTANIVQEKQIELFSASITSTGKIIWKKPNRIMIEMNPPDGSQLYFNGSVLWIYYPEEKVAERYAVQDSGAFSKAFFMFNPFSSAADDFISSAEMQQGTIALTFSPPGHLFSAVKIWVESALCLVRKVELMQKNGDKTVLTYNNAAINTDVSDKVFSFSPPEGTAVHSREAVSFPWQ